MDALGFGAMDLDTQSMVVEGLTLMTTTSPLPCWFLSLSLLVPEPVDNLVEPDHPVPLAFPVIAPGSSNSRETAADMNIFH